MNDGTPNIVNMVGGLGNQLFQYLFGTCLSTLTGRETVYDLSDYTTYNRHGGFALDRLFVLPLAVADHRQLELVPLAARWSWTKRFINKVPMASQLIRDIVVDANVLKFADIDIIRSKYFCGFWQGLEYSRSQIGDFLSSRKLHSDIDDRIDRAISESEINVRRSAAVHIRLGDYLASRTACQLPLDEAYYTKIITGLLARGDVDEICVFSDDIPAVKSSWFRNLPVKFIGPYTGQSGASDMIFLSRFAHIVISASTFGWWAATFSRDAVVHAPWPWVRAAFVAVPRYSAYLPAEWRRYESMGHDLVLDTPHRVAHND